MKKSFILDVSITSYLPNPHLGTLLDSFFKKISCNAALFSFISNQLRLRFSENMFSWNWRKKQKNKKRCGLLFGTCHLNLWNYKQSFMAFTYFFMYEMQNIPVREIWSQSTKKLILSYFVCYSFYILKTLKFGLQPHKKKLLQLVFE